MRMRLQGAAIQGWLDSGQHLHQEPAHGLGCRSQRTLVHERQSLALR